MGRASTPGKRPAILLAVVVGAMAVLVSCCSAGGSAGAGRRTPASTAAPDSVYGRAASLTGPVTVGDVIEPESAHPGNLPPGYREEEFFASGTARAFRVVTSPDNGRWEVSPTTSSSYMTRIIVRRPESARLFNGTVVVEWFNESAGESSPDWDYMNPELGTAGFAYVGVSAQALGVNGGTAILGVGATGGLTRAEPARYGSLHHPGDRYSYDIFSQIGRALRSGTAPAVLGGLHPRHVVAVGESQSAYFLTTFADAVEPRTGAYDGIFIHSRGGGAAPLDGGALTGRTGPGVVRIRTDLAVPVFVFETETDLAQLGYAAATQPDTARIRLWEVAGTAHADSYIVGGFASALDCRKPINSGPQHLVVQAALAAFARWVAKGTPPASPPPIRLAGTAPVSFALDTNGNVLGGVRTPAVDVPLATLSGLPAEGSSLICSLFGSTTPLIPARLVQLYGTRTHFLELYARSLDRAITSGFILPADRAPLLQEAGKVPLPA